MYKRMTGNAVMINHRSRAVILGLRNMCFDIAFHLSLCLSGGVREIEGEKMRDILYNIEKQKTKC